MPDRAEPAFGSTRKSTRPVALPLYRAVNVIHDALLLAVHGHPLRAATTNDPVPPNAGNEAPEGSILHVHGSGGAGACETVNARPAIVSVPLRAAPVALACDVARTVPFPLPAPPAVIDSHDALLDAAHEQSGAVVTVAATFPPPGPTVALVGAIA